MRLLLLLHDENTPPNSPDPSNEEKPEGDHLEDTNDESALFEVSGALVHSSGDTGSETSPEKYVDDETEESDR